jgi:hypothetical protein
MERLRGASGLLVGILLLCPVLAQAQASLTGVIRDNSGAVLPGVTVEATSPVLIERARTAVSDGSGQYRITELLPGTYSLSFTLSGFSVVKRDGVEVRGSGVVPINADMRIGAIEETITVTGESPTVDTQTTRREMVINAETLATLPVTRSYGTLLAAIPGIVTDNTSRGAMTEPFMTFFSANGGRANEGRMLINGMPVAASFNGGGVSTFIYDVANTEEMQVLVSGGLGEAEAGGPSVNLVPRSGGNAFRGTGFSSGTGTGLRSDNIDDYLRGIGLTRPPALLMQYDVSGALGGPLKRDRLWFFGTARDFASQTFVEGAFANRNAGDTTRWDYVQDNSVETRAANRRDILQLRLTAQVSARNRVSFSHEYQHRCSGSVISSGGGGCRGRGSDWIGLGTLTASPESWVGYHDFPYNVTQLTWTSPMSNRMLFESGFSRFQYLWAGFGQAPPDGLTSVIPVSEQAAIDGHRAFFTYRGTYDPLGFGWADNDANPNNWKASMAYVTGAHSLKVGYQGSYQRALGGRDANTTLLRYVFNNRVPVGVTYTLSPRWEQNDRTATTALYIQDQWTTGRLTLQGAVRYDRASSWAPAEHNGTAETSRFLPAPISFGRTVSVAGYNDVTPRVGAAWDIFGSGKTALKANVGKYLQNATNDENYTANNPSARIVRNVGLNNNGRGWQDGNGNLIVDCDLRSPAAQNNLATGGDNCAALTGVDANFGNANPNLTIVNPAILEGWGVRPSDWQLGVSVQHEVLPRVSVDAGYNRRWFNNFFVDDNQLVGPSNYRPWTYIAPQHPDLPDGGGFPVTTYSLTQALGARTYRTFETDFGPARTQYWHGVNVSVNARMTNGFTFQGGTSTGRGVRDTCETVVKIDNPDPRGCHVTEPVMTSLRGSASYTVPKVDVLVSTQIRNLNPNNVAPGGSGSATNGNSLNANVAIPNAVVQQLLGQLPAGALANGTTTVNLLTTGELYPEKRLTQVDMRFAKILRFGGRKADIGVDLYNLFNTNDTTTFEPIFDYATGGATWLRPTAIVPPRFARFNVTFSF